MWQVPFGQAPDARARLGALVRARTDELRAREWLPGLLDQMFTLAADDRTARAILTPSWRALIPPSAWWMSQRATIPSRSRRASARSSRPTTRVERLLEAEAVSSDRAFVRGDGATALLDALRTALQAARQASTWSVTRQAAARALLRDLPHVASLAREGPSWSAAGFREYLQALVAAHRRELSRAVAPPLVCDIHCAWCGAGAIDPVHGWRRCLGCGAAV